MTIPHDEEVALSGASARPVLMDEASISIRMFILGVEDYSGAEVGGLQYSDINADEHPDIESSARAPPRHDVRLTTANSMMDTARSNDDR